MQHIPSSEPAIPSVSQGNPGTSRNQEIHHRVQNSQKLVSIRAKIITVKPSDICWSSILVLFFHLHLRLTSGLQPSKFLNLNALCISLLLVCATRFPILFFLHSINFWSAAKIMKILIKQIYTSSCHFLRVRSKYISHHPIIEHLQSVFVREHRRPSFTPICNIRFNWISLIKRQSKYYV